VSSAKSFLKSIIVSLTKIVRPARNILFFSSWSNILWVSILTKVSSHSIVLRSAIYHTSVLKPKSISSNASKRSLMKNSIFENTNSFEWKGINVWVFIIDNSKAVRDTFIHCAQFKCRLYLDRKVRVHHLMLVVFLCLNITRFDIFNGALRTKARVGIWEIRMNLFFFRLFLGSLVLCKLRS
jgi:hypothetical protein